MMPNYAGMLRHSAIIEQENSAPDGQGGRVLSWAAFATVRISGLTPSSGREAYLHGRVEAPVFSTLYMRYHAGVRVDMRLTFNGLAHNIRSVIDIENRHRWMRLTVESGVTL